MNTYNPSPKVSHYGNKNNKHAQAEKLQLMQPRGHECEPHTSVNVLVKWFCLIHAFHGWTSGQT